MTPTKFDRKEVEEAVMELQGDSKTGFAHLSHKGYLTMLDLAHAYLDNSLSERPMMTEYSHLFEIAKALDDFKYKCYEQFKREEWTAEEYRAFIMKNAPCSYDINDYKIPAPERVSPERCQFTAYDAENYPEYNNSKYLEYKTIKTGISEAICCYGYKKNGKWITLEEVKAPPKSDVGAEWPKERTPFEGAGNNIYMFTKGYSEARKECLAVHQKLMSEKDNNHEAEMLDIGYKLFFKEAEIGRLREALERIALICSDDYSDVVARDMVFKIANDLEKDKRNEKS
jgi:hypothetical protein